MSEPSTTVDALWSDVVAAGAKPVDEAAAAAGARRADDIKETDIDD
jgi:hypothetical protein